MIQNNALNSIDVVSTIAAGVVTVDVIELDVIIQVSSNKVDCFVDLDRLGELAVRLQVPCFISRVLKNHISFGILIVSQPKQDNVRMVDPDLLPELAPDVTQALHPVEAHGFKTAVPKHFGHLSILLPIFLEDQFSLQAFVLVLTPSPVLSSLSFVLGHL